MFNTLTRMGASAAGAYEIKNSLRLNSDDNAYLRKDDYSSPDSGTTFTFSAWVKRGKLDNWFPIFGSWSGTNAFNLFGFSSNNRLIWRIRNSSSSDLTRKESKALYRDCNSWYHVVLQRNSTLATGADRQKLWVNGEQITDWEQDNNDNEDLTYSSDFLTDLQIGRVNTGSSTYKYADGYIAEVYYIDGQALPASNFGETDADTGQWVPKKYQGTYGSNGIYLDFSDNSNNSETTLGKDSSGNGNNFDPGNISVSAGVGNDSLEDTPTNNFASRNTEDGYSTLSYEASNGNLDYNISDTSAIPYSTMAIPTSGKWYAEFTATDLETAAFGFKPIDDFGLFSEGYLYAYHGKIWKNNSETQTVAAISDGDIIGVAVDRSAQTVQFSKNGTNIGNTEALVAGTEYKYWIARWASSGGNPQGSVNFGQRAFSHQPSGFKGLCTKNLPTPTIKDGTKYFNTVLYTGNGSDGRAVTGVGFQPNLVWIANRDRSTYKPLYDSVAGATKMLRTNTNDAEGTFSTVLQSFDSDGFTVGTDSAHNHNGEDIVSWNWKEGASNGFDIVSFTPSSGTNTYSHSLGVKPDFIIFKSRGSDANWDVYNATLTAEYKLYLNGADLKIDSGFMSDTEPTSSVFSFNPGNQDGNVHLAYCFSNVEGYSKAGKYTGNGSSNGVFIYTGFKPAYLLSKRTTVGGGQDWEVRDTGRNTYNPVSTRLVPNETYHEGDLAAKDIDFVSNGIKIRTSSSGVNSSGIEYVYLAFAESPFKYANAR